MFICIIVDNFFFNYEGFFSRKEYEDAKMQAKKGKKWFRKTLSKIVGLQKWNYVCFVTFPNLENRDVLKRNNMIREAEEILVNLEKLYHLIHMQIYQNVITKEEINDITMKWWTDRMKLNESLPPVYGL